MTSYTVVAKGIGNHCETAPRKKDKPKLAQSLMCYEQPIERYTPAGVVCRLKNLFKIRSAIWGGNSPNSALDSSGVA